MQPFTPSRAPVWTTGTAPPPGMLRRLAAVGYDTLILVGLWLLADLLFVLVADGLGEPVWPRWLLQACLWLVAYGFFAWFWLHGGQTLGMRVWRLKLVAVDGPVTPRITFLRFSAATLSWVLFGAGFFWMLLDRDRRSWHDHASRTRLILVPKRSARAVQQVEGEDQESHGRQGGPEDGGQAVQQGKEAEAAIQHEKHETQHDAAK